MTKAKRLYKTARSQVKDPFVNSLMELFTHAYQKSLNDLGRLQDLQNMYDNTPTSVRWPTISQIPIPMLFTMVERILPDIVEYLFPTSKFIQLNPIDPNISMESVERAEWALQNTLMTRMRIQDSSYETIKDCFKLSLGYGIVEPVVVTPPAAFVTQIYGPEGEVARARGMGLGRPKRTVRFRSISPGQIIVTPDGSRFNGADRVGTSFFIDTYHEDDFREMYSNQPSDGENPLLQGDAEAIIQQARDLGFEARVPIVSLVALLGGHDLRQTNQPDPRIPVQVPVLKCYARNEHIWLANGLTRIFHQRNKYQTMRCPLIKCSAWPDGKRFYPMSAPEAAQKMALGVNVWLNALFDLMTKILKPTLVYDKTALGNKPPERGPNADVGVSGPVTDAVKYIEPPRIPPELFTMGDILQRLHGAAVGQESFMSEPQPGLMRGGLYAFESLLQSTTGRERMAGAILETRYIEPLIKQTLIYMQLNIGAEGDMYALRDFDPETGDEYIQEMQVTEEDLVNAYELAINLKAKHRNSAIEQQQRLAEYNAFKGDEYFDQYELRKETIGDETRGRRMILPRDKVREMQAQNREMEIRERELGIQRARNTAQPTTTQEQQGLMGAGAAAAGG